MERELEHLRGIIASLSEKMDTWRLRLVDGGVVTIYAYECVCVRERERESVCVCVCTSTYMIYWNSGGVTRVWDPGGQLSDTSGRVTLCVFQARDSRRTA